MLQTNQKFCRILSRFNIVILKKGLSMKNHKTIIFTMLLGVFSYNKVSAIADSKYEGKEYIGAQQFLEDSFGLARLIFDSDFRPTFVISLLRGGTPVANTIIEFFSHKKMPIKKYVATRVSAYNTKNKLKKEVTVFDLSYVVKTIRSVDKLLIVDDVIDTGSSMTKLLEELKKQCGDNFPKNFKIATVYYKPKMAMIEKPEFCVHETNAWLVFPHELMGLTEDEIRQCKGEKISVALKGG
jgi:hypoxanthine phosphoribosyltransferase